MLLRMFERCFSRLYVLNTLIKSRASFLTLNYTTPMRMQGDEWQYDSTSRDEHISPVSTLLVKRYRLLY